MKEITFYMYIYRALPILLALGMLLMLCSCSNGYGEASSTPVEETTTTVTTTSTSTTTMAKPTTTTTVKPTNKTKKTTTKPLTPVTVSFIETTKPKDEPIPAFDGTLTVYQIDRTSFLNFIENPSFAWFKNESSDKIIFTEADEEGYFISSGDRFSISEELITLMGNKKAISNLLKKNGTTDAVQGAVLFEGGKIRPTIWVKTSKDNLFITINEGASLYKPNKYVFRVYKQAEYYDKYRVRAGRLIVKGKDITGSAPMNIYHNYADLPMMTVFKALEGTVKKQSESLYTLRYAEQTYILDLAKNSLVRQGEEAVDVLHNIDGGGTYYIYPVEQELMVDDRSLTRVLQLMGMDGTIIVDYDNAQVLVM